MLQRTADLDPSKTSHPVAADHEQAGQLTRSMKADFGRSSVVLIPFSRRSRPNIPDLSPPVLGSSTFIVKV